MDDCQPKTNIDPGNQFFSLDVHLLYVDENWIEMCLICRLMSFMWPSIYIEASLIEADTVQGLQWRIGSSISSTMIMTRFEVHYESRSYTFMALFVFSNRHWKVRVRDLKETIFDLLVLAITLISINDWTL